MLILKIKDKGLFIDIPGASPTRTPAHIDITRCSLISVESCLRKAGVKKYEIVSEVTKPKTKRKKVVSKSKPKKTDDSIDQRFSKLERMMEELLKKSSADPPTNSEQITDKLDQIESLTKRIVEKEPRKIEKPKLKNKKVKKSKSDDTESFIPTINTSGMKMKSGSKKTLKKEMDVDDNVDLLSRIMGNDD
jgi:hypothetical protein